MALERGTKLGPYQIESPLGAGGMGARLSVEREKRAGLVNLTVRPGGTR